MKSAREWFGDLPPDPGPIIKGETMEDGARKWRDWGDAVIRHYEAIQRDALEAAADAIGHWAVEFRRLADSTTDEAINSQLSERCISLTLAVATIRGLMPGAPKP